MTYPILVLFLRIAICLIDALLNESLNQRILSLNSKKQHIPTQSIHYFNEYKARVSINAKTMKYSNMCSSLW